MPRSRWCRAVAGAALCLLAALGVDPAGAATCKRYAPEVTSLRGTLVARTFPGPPGYRSVGHGDAAQTEWILRLRHPLCVEAAGGESDVAESAQQEVQLVLTPAQVEEYRELLGRAVVATGTLFHARGAEHRRAVLLTTALLEPAT